MHGPVQQILGMDIRAAGLADDAVVGIADIEHFIG